MDDCIYGDRTAIVVTFKLRGIEQATFHIPVKSKLESSNKSHSLFILEPDLVLNFLSHVLSVEKHSMHC